MIEYVFGLAVRAIIIDDDDKILILKRSMDSKTNPGKWELPGGKVDQGEPFDQALIREVEEETGLIISLDTVVGASQQNLPLIRAVHIIMSGKIVGGELKISSEHEGYAWEFFENLNDYELADWLEYFIKGSEKQEDEVEKEEGSEGSLSNTVIKTLGASVDRLWGKR
ncbi:MAG: NUDIX domain-containing protein [Methanobacteriaceae archaeon]|nr:NUDIX domain-containing protein [Methanobacteriaceae archaeon]OPY22346.1 MAG: ADP-ribose pyrophosphatase [Methanobacterium sp. PtaU1.Bin097]